MTKKIKLAKWITLDEACRIVSISRSACLRWVKEGKIDPQFINIEARTSGGNVHHLKHPEWAIDVSAKLNRSNPATKLYSEKQGKFINLKSYAELEEVISAKPAEAKPVSPVVQAISRKDNLEAEKLELANQKARVDLAVSLGELVKIDDVKHEFKEKMTIVAQMFDDLPYKIAESCQRLDYDDLITESHKVVEKLKEKILEIF
jgi:hypothetical protein